MKHALALILIALFLQVNALEMELKPAQNHERVYDSKLSLELDVFGLSYHSNRNYDFNEKNPGLGVSVVFSSDTPDPGWHFSMVASAGTYRDSYNEQAEYFLIGPRFTLGYENSFHASLAMQAGYLDGSGKNGQAIIPFVTVGYDRINVGITGDPFGVGDENSQDTSKMVAVFLKFRVLDF